MLSTIVAIAENNAIGINGKMPWHLPGDLKYFKKVTQGKTLIMGRKTFESLPGILPGRRHLVLTNDQNLYIEGVEVEKDADALFKHYQALDEEAFIIGGATIYEKALPFCQKLYLTRILKSYNADTYFPCFDINEYELLSRSEIFTDEATGTQYRFDVYSSLKQL